MNKKIIMPIALLTLLSLAVFVSAWTIEYGTTINEGWNLVYAFIEPEQIQGIEPSNIKAIYGFMPTTQEYVRFYPNPEMDKITLMDGDQFRNTAFWVYSDAETGKEFNGRYNGVEYWLAEEPIPYNERQLYEGWNFVGITSDMVGKSVEEIKGTCSIEKQYIWISSEKKWATFPEMIYPSMAGKGFIIKVSEDCKLGTPTGEIDSPPTIPN
jgi:hypothetical protein